MLWLKATGLVVVEEISRTTRRKHLMAENLHRHFGLIPDYHVLIDCGRLYLLNLFKKIFFLIVDFLENELTLLLNFSIPLQNFKDMKNKTTLERTCKVECGQK